MEINTTEPHPKPIEEMVAQLKEICDLMFQIQQDLIIIKSFMSKHEKGKPTIDPKWWIF
tara:strand:- start:709 stop:885 length:177 start_codon:yes stop_codon:yes gene_type:complete